MEQLIQQFNRSKMIVVYESSIWEKDDRCSRDLFRPAMAALDHFFIRDEDSRELFKEVRVSDARQNPVIATRGKTELEAVMLFVDCLRQHYTEEEIVKRTVTVRIRVMVNEEFHAIAEQVISLSDVVPDTRT